MVCRDFILPESANYVFSYSFFFLRNLLYLIQKPATHWLDCWLVPYEIGRKQKSAICNNTNDTSITLLNCAWIKTKLDTYIGQYNRKLRNSQSICRKGYSNFCMVFFGVNELQCTQWRRWYQCNAAIGKPLTFDRKRMPVEINGCELFDDAF